MTPVSFTIDHTKLVPGIYLQAEPGKVYTYDLRFVAPAVSETEGIPQAVMHTFEHCLAQFLRGNSSFKDNILYVGPMGCCTGFYLLMNSEVEYSEIAKYLVGAFDYVLSIDEIPAANAQQCGNYRLNDLEKAKELSLKLKEIFKEGNYCTTYPELILEDK
ncbi:MAG: S-ribosylhomocysteine lyase [Rikenellaceae bacterium]